MEQLLLWLNTVGLTLGVLGALGLTIFTKDFIRINADGTETWGPPKGVSNEEWKSKNLKLRRNQKYFIPCSYIFIGSGFILQLICLWIPQL